MDKLDENYLDLVREKLYKKQLDSPAKHVSTWSKKPFKSKPKAGDNEDSKNRVQKEFKTKKETFKGEAKVQNLSQKKAKPKQVKFFENVGDKSESNIPEYKESSREVKNRVVTPFKKAKEPGKLKIQLNSPNLNMSDTEMVSIVSEKLSPSLNESDSFQISKLGKRNNGKNKKRLLSESESSEEHVKRKKGKPFINKGKKLLFDDCLDDFEITKVPNCSTDISNKIKSKKNVKNRPLGLTNFSLGGIEDESYLNRSLKNEKNKEKMEKPRKKVKNKFKNIDNTKTSDVNLQNDYIEFGSSDKTLNLALESSSEGLVTLNLTADKKSNYNSGKQNKKSKKLKVKTKNVGFKKVFNSSDISLDSSDVEFKPLKKPSTFVGDPEDFSDSYDNGTIGVKGLKFQRFCNLFTSTYNEQFIGHSSNALSIPQKYFKVSKNDFESDWQCKEVLSPRRKKMKSSKKASRTNESDNSLVDQEVPITETVKLGHLDSPNKKREQRKKITVLDVQILSPQSHPSQEDSVIDILAQKIANETLDSQEDLAEATKLVENSILRSKENEEETEVEAACYPNLGIKNSLETQPVILTLKNGNKVVALNRGYQIHFHGLCVIQVLNGEVEILGASLNSVSGEKKLYSPRGTALLYIKNESTFFVNSSVKLKHLVSEELLYESDIELTFNQHYAIFVCSKLKDICVDFIEKYIPQKIFPETNEALRVDFKLQGSWNRIQISDQWQEILENIPKDSKTVIAGGKGVGKSTFLRYTLNFLLRQFVKIRVLDLDPGQSEFYPPGCISAVTVDKDVFGPNYTHLLEPDRLILSHINMGYDIHKYLKSVKHLLELTKSLETLPTLINFPGFTQGLGLDISAESLKLLEPTLVIQINSKSHTKNYKTDMTVDSVNRLLKEKNILSQDESNDFVDLDYDFVKFESLAEGSEAWTLEARQGREINILAYFGKLMAENINDFASADINMYSISISAVSVVNSEGKSISPLAINANLVALCSKLDKHSEIFSCYGYGFVRGMDLLTDTLILITPEKIETLVNVSHLVLSSVTIPPSLLMTANSVKGHIPYVSVGDPVDFGQFTRRSYLPPKK